MSNIGANAQQLLLNFMNRAATSPSPPAQYVALSTGSPTSAAAVGLVGEISAGSGYGRSTCAWGVASQLAAGGPYQATNTNAMTFGPFSSNCNISGVGIIDSVAVAGTGQANWFGLLAAARNITAGDSLVIAAGALTSQIN